MTPDLTTVVAATMDKMRADPKLVRKLSDHPEVAYVKEALGW